MNQFSHKHGNAYLSIPIVELVNDEFAHSSSDRAGSTTVD
jgi:hypothetical protein